MNEEQRINGKKWMARWMRPFPPPSKCLRRLIFASGECANCRCQDADIQHYLQSLHSLPCGPGLGQSFLLDKNEPRRYCPLVRVPLSCSESAPILVAHVERCEASGGESLHWLARSLGGNGYWWILGYCPLVAQSSFSSLLFPTVHVLVLKCCKEQSMVDF